MVKVPHFIKEYINKLIWTLLWMSCNGHIGKQKNCIMLNCFLFILLIILSDLVNNMFF